MITNRQSAISGLGTDTYKVEIAGMYYLSARATVVPPSGLVITLAQTGSTSVSVSTPTTADTEVSITINNTFNCAVNDILTVQTTSSAAADQPPNKIQTLVILRQGL